MSQTLWLETLNVLVLLFLKKGRESMYILFFYFCSSISLTGTLKATFFPLMGLKQRLEEAVGHSNQKEN